MGYVLEPYHEHGDHYYKLIARPKPQELAITL
jgi:hypothetical protein